MNEESIKWFEKQIKNLKLVGAELFIIRIYEDMLERLKKKRNTVICEGVP